MSLSLLQNKLEIEAYLLKYPFLNYYHLGDLDDFFWPYTTWYSWKSLQRIEAIALIYRGMDPTVLLAISNYNDGEMCKLLEALLPLLPHRFYSHLSPGLETILARAYHLEHHGEYMKMGLEMPKNLSDVDVHGVERLGKTDLVALEDFYAESYPGNWFDPRMLETDHYMGFREQGKLVAVAGVHVYSAQYKIAALGNIAVHPKFRGRGIGKKVTAYLCQELLKTVDRIGLNVRSDNLAACRVYQSLGFREQAVYHEYMVSVE